MSRLKHLLRLHYGDALAADQRATGDVPVFGSNGSIGNHNQANTKAPVVLVGRKGSFGKIVWSDSAGFCIDTAYFVDERSCAGDLRFAFYALQTLNLDKLSKDTGVPGLSRDDAHERKLRIPPVGEQTAIAHFLDRETARIDSLIEKKGRFIELLAEKRAAVITHAVTKGLDPNAPMKDSGVDWLGDVPATWTISRLRFHVLINPSQKEQRKLDPKRLTSFFPMEAIGEKGELDHVHTRHLDEVQTGYSYFADGDVVVAKVTPCFENGKGAIMSGLIGGFGFGTTEITTLRSDESLDQKFLYLLTSTSPFRKIGVSHMTGAGGLKRVPDEFFRNFSFGMPPLAEQRAIVEYVENQTPRIDTLIAKTECSIELLREKRSALITAAVTGKIDVRAAA